jgi:hypothetical protein
MEDASDDLLWQFGLMTEGQPEIIYVEFQETYMSPGVIAYLETTSLYGVQGFLRRTQNAAPSLFSHYREAPKLDMRTHLDYMKEYIEFLTEKTKERKSDS